MTTAIATKARKKIRPPEPEPEPVLLMTVSEAEESLERIGRAAADWTIELVAFHDRQGWVALGYPSIRHCLSDRLKVGIDSTLAILRAATTKNAVAALTTLHREHERRGSRFIAVWLPTLPEYATGDVDPLRNAVVGNLRAAGVRVMDLTRDFRDLPAAEVDRFFLAPEDVIFPVGGRHYSESGHEFVARSLWRRLRRLPEFAGAGENP